MKRIVVRFRGLLILAVLLATATACDGLAASGPNIRVEDAWGRPTPQMFNVAAFYMVLQNKGTETDRLMGGKSPLCGVVELHETYLTDDGASGMRPVPGGFIEVPAGDQVELKPGSYHFMCIDKQVDFAAGDKLPITLYFEKSGDKTLEISIQ
jgi:hypothetical protein